MKPIPFKEQTTVIAKDQKEYIPVPAYICNNKEHEMICFIEVTDEEIEKIKELGGFYYSVWRFGTEESKGKFANPLQPFRMMVESPFVDRIYFTDNSIEYLKEVCKEGTEIGHEVLSLDRGIMIVSEVHENGIKYLFIETGIEHTTTWKSLLMMVNASQNPLKYWFTHKKV